MENTNTSSGKKIRQSIKVQDIKKNEKKQNEENWTKSSNTRREEADAPKASKVSEGREW